VAVIGWVYLHGAAHWLGAGKSVGGPCVEDVKAKNQECSGVPEEASNDLSPISRCTFLSFRAIFTHLGQSWPDFGPHFSVFVVFSILRYGILTS
jgi:hypothetical protein